MIEEECKKFNVMFEGSAKKKSSRLNILFFCATSYASKVQEKFGKKNFFLSDFGSWEYIDEVIVLDLSSENNRAEFFGLASSDELNQVINMVIAKSTSKTDA
jgi:hypothetical protein